MWCGEAGLLRRGGAGSGMEMLGRFRLEQVRYGSTRQLRKGTATLILVRFGEAGLLRRGGDRW
jgi:hypothetical protein